MKRTTRRRQAAQSVVEDRQASDESLNRCRRIVNACREHMILVDRGYRYEAVNDAYCKALGKQRGEIEGKTLAEVWGEAPFHKAIKNHVDRCFKGCEVHLETWLRLGSEERRCYEVTGYPYYDEDNTVSHVVVISRDVTEAKRAEQALRRSEQKYRDIFESGVIGVFQATLEGRHISANSAFARMLGYDSPQDLMNTVTNIAEQIYADPRVRAEVLRQIQASEGIARFECELLRKDGGRITVYQNIRLVRNEKGVPMYLEGFIEDITERKKMEEALRESEKQLRLLSAQLLIAQEEERKRIAVELHDSIGQSLAAVKFSVENALKIKNSLGMDEMLKSLGLIVPTIQNAMEDARRIYMGLRPSMLDDLGIVSTIGWFCREFKDTHPEKRVECGVDIEEGTVPEHLKIVIFRVVQEALNNIAKHSKAERVFISLTAKNGGIELTIEDNGVGFDRDAALSRTNRRRGLGLSGMKERSELSGGVFSIRTSPNEGTTIRVHWPLQNDLLSE